MEEVWPDQELRSKLRDGIRFLDFEINIFQGQYIPKNPVSRVIQCAAVASENEVEQAMKQM